MLRTLLLLSALSAAAASRFTCVDCPLYNTASARDKADIIAEKLESTEYSRFPNDWYTLSEAKLFTESMDEPFDRFSDQLPNGRKKLVHTFASVAGAKFVAEPNSYTGLFQGADYCYVRLSLANDPLFGFAPGQALKCLRDGTYSGNIIAMWALDGQGKDYNFFKHEFRSHIAPVPITVNPALAAVGKIFKKGQDPDSFKLNVDAFSFADQQGNVVSNPSFPTQVFLVPNPQLQSQFESWTHDWRDDLDTIQAGTTLWDVYAGEGCHCGADPCLSITECNDQQKVGSIVTTSRFIASKWGDESMYFQHSRTSKKPRQTCVYAKALDDDHDVRFAGRHNAACIAGTLCPQQGWFNTLKQADNGCPFGWATRSLAGENDEILEAGDEGRSTLYFVIPAIALVVVAVVGAVVFVRHRRQSSYGQMVEEPATAMRPVGSV